MLWAYNQIVTNKKKTVKFYPELYSIEFSKNKSAFKNYNLISGKISLKFIEPF